MTLPLNIYDLAYLSVLPPAAVAVGYKMLRRGKYRESAPALIGLRIQQENPTPWKDGSIWVHAVSVGEVIAARAMLPLLREKFAPLPILLTTHTETGQATARNLPEGMVDAVRYYPIDFSWLMKKYVNVFRPKVFIPMETELWPNALDIIASSGAKIFTLNGKISEKSFRNYQKIQRLIRKPLSKVTAFCVQTENDKARVAQLLGHANNVHITGNCKFDVDIPLLDREAQSQLASQLGLPWPARAVIAGSTHPGEEAIILEAFCKIKPRVPDLHLVIVPRHPERFEDVWAFLQAQGVPARRISDGAASVEKQPCVHLLDKMGLLTEVYGLAEIAIVAGSFTRGIGGHNILEPAAHGVPVVYGPDMNSQPDMVKILSPANGGTQSSPHWLAEDLLDLLTDTGAARDKGNRGRQVYQANRGSARRNIDVISQYLDNW